MLKKILITTLPAISAFALHTAEININDQDLELSAKFDMGQVNTNVEPNTIFIGGRFLSGQKENSRLEDGNYLTNIEPIYEVNFLMKRAVSNIGLSLGMGVKFNSTKDFSTLPLGLEFEYVVPTKTILPMYLYGSAYYAPVALSFNDAKNFFEYRISYDIELIDNGRITIGYRQLNTNYDNSKSDVALSNVIYNESFYAGFKFAF